MSIDRPLIVRVGLVNWIHGSPRIIDDEWFGQVVVVVPRWSVSEPGRSFEVVDCISGSRGILQRDLIEDLLPDAPEVEEMWGEDQYTNHVRCQGIIASLCHRSDALPQPEELDPGPLSERSLAMLASDEEFYSPVHTGVPGYLIRFCDRASNWLRRRFPPKY